jgi:putative membrane protein
MKKLSMFMMVLLSGWLLQGCNGNTKSSSSTDSTAKQDVTAVKDTSIKKDTSAKMSVAADNEDVKFAAEAASGGLTEVALGKLAQQKGVDKRVKNFGGMMVMDHSKANNEFKLLANSKNITLPTAPNADDQKVIDEMSKKSGKDFDKAYVNDMVDDHKKDIKKFEDASKNCKDPDIRAFATKTLPVLNKHLEAINTIHDSMK